MKFSETVSHLTAGLAQSISTSLPCARNEVPVVVRLLFLLRGRRLQDCMRGYTSCFGRFLFCTQKHRRGRALNRGMLLRCEPLSSSLNAPTFSLILHNIPFHRFRYSIRHEEVVEFLGCGFIVFDVFRHRSRLISGLRMILGDCHRFSFSLPLLLFSRLLCKRRSNPMPAL